ncbi:uncharacterized protein BXIN_1841 [Babesia sp. Xinjiang]|uniref:uncharacterized protein n=1 Tax=Babesia sp. Xinjiang TaxID=462227 RepID=UPI000A25B795|nr:uncharacterized protein BXIN_1841 [Babesia sp. Xinjiang]ORM40469.1 hypothetical protein BXIN_1841 [Babesia sp. Xinjiang]
MSNIYFYLLSLCGLLSYFTPALAFLVRVSSPLDFSTARPIQRSESRNTRFPTVYSYAIVGDFVDGDLSETFTGPHIDSKGQIINKKKKLYSYGSLRHVDDFFEGKYHVEWIVRGVSEKLQFRRRESGSPPLHTSRFTFAGIGGFLLRLWLDGLPSSEPGHLALSFLQKEHWATLDSPLSISVGKFTRGPFFFRSSPYFAALKSFCPLKEAVEDNELHIRVGLATR